MIARTFSLSVPGGGEGRGETGDSSEHAHLTLPSPCDGPLPLSPVGGEGFSERAHA